MRFLVGALVAIACIAITTPVISETSAKALTTADREKLISAAEKLRAATLHVDTAALISLISSTDGLECTDARYKKAQVSQYISRTDSILYEGLFDAARFSRRCGAGYPAKYPATSDKAFFESAPSGSVEVEFVKDNYATVKFTSATAGYYPREYSFKKERGDWKLVGGLIIGNCTCG
jgi:hypothetical protein